MSLFLLIPILLSFLSCKEKYNQQRSNESIKFRTLPYKIGIEQNIRNIHSVNLSEAGTSIEYIVLETMPGSLIQNIDQIAMSDSLIFISNYKIFLLFNRNGGFIRQIGSWGRGPGEYSHINDFCIDTCNKRIYILDGWKVLEYDFNGNFTRQFIVPRYSSSFLIMDTGRFILYQFNFPLDSIDRKYSWYITDRNGNIEESINNNYNRTKTPGMLIRKMPLYSFNNEVHFIEFGADTLFHFSVGYPEPYAIFNFGKLKMPYDFYIPAPEDRRILNKYLWLSTVQEDNRFIYFSTIMGISDSSRCGIFDKKTFRTVFLKNNSFINDIDEGPSFWPLRVFNDTVLVSWIDGFKIFEYINKKLSDKSGFKDRMNREKFETLKGRLNETSNPVLMIVR
ncbi:MAG TPA: 6-bladed beta-propeller [Bacteroidales bacterium]|nr:6-bladed beta-propeller [Bacteroidales bacterium]